MVSVIIRVAAMKLVEKVGKGTGVENGVVIMVTEKLI